MELSAFLQMVDGHVRGSLTPMTWNLTANNEYVRLHFETMDNFKLDADISMLELSRIHDAALTEFVREAIGRLRYAHSLRQTYTKGEEEWRSPWEHEYLP